jgi:hypothetical protein
VLKPVIEFRRAKFNNSPDPKNRHPLQQLPIMRGFRSHRNVFNFNKELVQKNSNYDASPTNDKEDEILPKFAT